MTTITVTNPHRRSSGHFRDVASAELTKFRSVRSSYWSLVVGFLTTVAIAGLVTFAVSNLVDEMTTAERMSFDPTAVSLIGLSLGQLIIASIGIRAVTSEYSSGLIRTTLAAVPRRRSLLLAKATVVGGVAVAAGTVMSTTSFLLGQVLLGRADLGASLGDPGVARALVGAGCYIGVVALVGLGLGTVIRHTGGTWVALFGVVFLLPAITAALPSSWSWLRDSMLSSAGDALMIVRPEGSSMSVSRAVLVCLLWTAGSLGAAAFAISKRDA